MFSSYLRNYYALLCIIIMQIDYASIFMTSVEMTWNILNLKLFMYFILNMTIQNELIKTK